MFRTAAVDALLVTELFPPTIGGSGILLANLYGRMKGSQITVVTDGPAARLTDPGTGLPLIKIPMQLQEWGLLKAKPATVYLKVARTIASSRCDRTIVYCARALPEGLAAFLARLLWRGPRYVVWTHGEELVTYQTSRELTWLLTQVHQRATAVFANSVNTRRMLESLGVPSAKIAVIYPGVDAARFTGGRGESTRDRLGWRDNFIMLSVGRLQSRKGHDLVIRSLGDLRSRRPDIRYLIVGEGDERQKLETLVREQRLTDVVRFAGQVSDLELPDFYAAADIFVHPNRIDDDGDVEGFGMVFLEAAAAGLPVIGGNSGGVPEAVAHEVTGFLVNGRDVDEFVNAVLRLAHSPALRFEMGRAGRERVLSNFTWDASVSKLSQLHQAIQHSHWPV